MHDLAGVLEDVHLLLFICTSKLRAILHWPTDISKMILSTLRTQCRPYISPPQDKAWFIEESNILLDLRLNFPLLPFLHSPRILLSDLHTHHTESQKTDKSVSCGKNTNSFDALVGGRRSVSWSLRWKNGVR